MPKTQKVLVQFSQILTKPCLQGTKEHGHDTALVFLRGTAIESSAGCQI